MKKLLLLVISACLIACSSAPIAPPTPFETGPVISAPQGCIQLRQENPKADC